VKLSKIERYILGAIVVIIIRLAFIQTPLAQHPQQFWISLGITTIAFVLTLKITE
jgi:hypothetical protein